MTIREEYEYLKTELMVQLTDATTMCNLIFPFDVKIPKAEEDKYFLRGTKPRLATKKSMIILDNTYKKVRLFPSEEIAQTFIETQRDILSDWKKDVLEAYLDEAWRFNNGLDLDSYGEYIDGLIKKIKEASIPYVNILKTLTPEEVEKEIEAKDKLRKVETDTPLKNPKKENKRGLF